MTAHAYSITKTLLLCVLAYFSLFCQCYSVLAISDSNINNTRFSLTAGKRLMCIDQKESINITCELVTRTKVNNSKPASWNILWRSEGEIIEQNYSIIHQTNTSFISSLSIYVNWTGAKVFTCFAAFKEENISKQSINLNSSITIDTKPHRTAIDGVRFIEGNDEYKILEIYWKQTDSETYNLQYSIQDDDSEFGDKFTYEIECLYRFYDVYRVPNTTGHICKASIKRYSVPLYVEHRVSVTATRGQCQSTGPIKKVYLQYYGKDPGPNKYDLLLIPHPVVNFVIHVARQRRVHLAWANLPDIIDAHRRGHLLKYNCSGVKMNETKLKRKTNITLHSADFRPYRPYAFCQFCVQACLPDSDVYSEPVCRKARLHEERPTEPPKITCNGDECATAVDGLYWNVTVTWDLPPRETWNGNLTYFVLYYRARNGSKDLKIVERNLSRRFVVLPRLARNSSYDVKMSVCNKEGCSPFGNAFINRERFTLRLTESPTNQESRSSNEVTTSLDISILIGVVVAVLLLVIISFYVIRQVFKKRAERRQQLPKIHEPKATTMNYDYISEMETVKEYHVINDEETEHGEDNKSLNSTQKTSA